jgi:Ca2+-dependent lipid-binding protein
MKLELSLNASGLKNVAGGGPFKGKSDPFAVVTNIATTPGSKPQVIGRTEVCNNTLNPEWTTTFFIDYELGTPSSLAVSIFDHEEKQGREHKPMGSAVFDVAAMLGARGNTKAKKLKKGGTLFAHVAKVQGQGVLRLRLKGLDLKNVEGWVGKSDPFFEISRQVNAAGGATWDNVYRSKSVPDTLNPTWDDATMELSTLCNGDLDRPIRIQVFDYEGTGKHVSMGAFETTVNNLVASSAEGGAGTDQRPFTLQSKKGGRDVGRVQVLKALVAGHSTSTDVTEKMATMSVEDKAVVAAAAATTKKGPTFVDYISGGCEINVVVAIDFTGSNGNPSTPGTLHYLGGGQPNDYQKAIRAILTVLSQYDCDAKYPVLGFG